jgi:flavin-dependent dehydrogenase
MIPECDVAVLGGGPAGTSAAIQLAKLGRRVVLFERADFEKPRFGETLEPDIRPLLEQLGAWERFQAVPQVPFRSILSSWGGSQLMARSSLLHPLGEGWHVDRARVDCILAETAGEAGAEIHLNSGNCGIVGVNDGWLVTPTQGSQVHARFLIDASGRGAPATAAALPDRRWERLDRLVAVAAWIQDSDTHPHDSDLLLEAVETGWWYLAPQPGGRFVAVYLTDGDLLPGGGQDALWSAWSAALEKTNYAVQWISRMKGFTNGPNFRTVRADSGASLPDRGEGWIVAGDAALAGDPLSGSGFIRALRSGAETAAAVDGALTGNLPPGDATGRWARYRDSRHFYYELETRWPESGFWKRRSR